MPKKTYVKNNGDWKPIKDAFVKVNGVWEPSIPKIKVPLITGKSLVKGGFGYTYQAISDPKLAPRGYKIIDHGVLKTITAKYGTNSMKIARMINHPDPNYRTTEWPTWPENQSNVPTDLLKMSLMNLPFRSWTSWLSSDTSGRYVGLTLTPGSTDFFTRSVVLSSSSSLGLNSDTLTTNNMSQMAVTRFYRPLFEYEYSYDDGTIIDRVKDIDGNIYDLTKVMFWAIARQNLATSRLNDGTALVQFTHGQSTYNLEVKGYSPITLGVSPYTNQAFFANSNESWWEEPSNISGWKDCSADLTIGQEWGGGIIFYKDSSQILIASKNNYHQEYRLWTNQTTDISTSNNVGEGYNNTQLMVQEGSPLANFVTSLSINGYSDWYIPSKDEAELVYKRAYFFTTRLRQSTEYDEYNGTTFLNTNQGDVIATSSQANQWFFICIGYTASSPYNPTFINTVKNTSYQRAGVIPIRRILL